MVVLSQNLTQFEVRINEVISLFSKDKNLNLEITLEEKDKVYILDIKVEKQKKMRFLKEVDIETADKLNKKRELTTFITSNLYSCLSKYYNVSFSWGALTGVRPAKLIYEMLDSGYELESALNEVEKKFYVKKDKLKLLEMCVKNQIEAIKNDKTICLYIHIPICPTRCSYCSFVSTDFAHAHQYLDLYVEHLIKELNYTIGLIKQNNIKVGCIYIGGGTPTSLSAEQLEKLLSVLQQINSDKVELTVECGRADTINREKFEVLQNANVTRISINPQTFDDNVLRVIGREHTAKQVICAYNLAREFNFDINMDIIAGLPTDTMQNFKKTIETLLELKPENITIHTLSIKRAAILHDQGNIEFCSQEQIEDMLNYAYQRLDKENYMPYYLYRQKNMLGAKENVGFTQKAKQCLFNIYSMEEMKPIIACGAGAISKKFVNGNIVRIANVKQITDYISRFDEMLKRKDEFFK